MVVRNSIRQLLRTPVKSLFFFVLLILTITFFLIGFNLWSMADQNIARIEHAFTTIGTVEQKSTSVETRAIWDAQKKGYFYTSYQTYGSRIPVSVLDFKGANYIQKPEKKPVYYAYHPDFVVEDKPESDAVFAQSHLIVLMEPLENSKNGDPTRVRIKRILFGRLNWVDELWVCDHYNDKPQPLYEGKTYIASLYEGRTHAGYDGYEYNPGEIIFTTQRNEDGSRAEDILSTGVPFDEVTENFYETPRGKLWLKVMDRLTWAKHTIPVVPTNSTNLLMDFFNGDARLIDGRNITAGEYQNGEKVCLIQRKFSEMNNLKVGESLRLPLYYADHYLSSSERVPPDPGYLHYGPDGFGLNAKGENYPAFEDSTYKIIGIYESRATTAVTGYEMGANAVVIPFASVKNSDANNIVSLGPMMGYTTSFQIPNGTIGEFMKAWEGTGITDLDIKFYDKGYSRIKAGLEAMKNTAIILFIAGGVTTLFVLLLFCHLFITKQRKRTAVERSLGMSKRLCTVSLLAGMLLIVAAACIFGSAAGFALTELTASQANFMQSQQGFDTTFSDWANSTDAAKISDASISTEGTAERALAGLLVLPAALLIALGSVRGNLKSEPLKMLSERER